MDLSGILVNTYSFYWLAQKPFIGPWVPNLIGPWVYKLIETMKLFVVPSKSFELFQLERHYGLQF